MDLKDLVKICLGLCMFLIIGITVFSDIKHEQKLNTLLNKKVLIGSDTLVVTYRRGKTFYLSNRAKIDIPVILKNEIK